MVSLEIRLPDAGNLGPYNIFCHKALKKLRNKSKVTDEAEQIKSEVNQNSGVAALSILQIFKENRLRWPIITGMIVHLSQQLCGINAVS